MKPNCKHGYDFGRGCDECKEPQEEEGKCEGNCPNTCKIHMGEYEFCTNEGCICHSSPLPQEEDCKPQDEEWIEKLDNGFRDGSLKWNGNKKNDISFERIKNFIASERLIALTSYRDAIMGEKKLVTCDTCNEVAINGDIGYYIPLESIERISGEFGI